MNFPATAPECGRLNRDRKSLDEIFRQLSAGAHPRLPPKSPTPGLPLVCIHRQKFSAMLPSMALPPMILASQSPRRVELLRQLVPQFGIVASHATESEDSSLGPRRLCELNAERKALLVAERYPDHLVLGADTVVFLDNLSLAKPADLDDARRMLGRLSGRVHEVITGVCLVHKSANRLRLFAEVTRVKFRTLTPEVIEDYLGRVHVLDKAGAYAAQDHGHLILDAMEGSLANVVGLPVESLRIALAHWIGKPGTKTGAPQSHD